MNDPYRDPLAGLRAQVQLLQADGLALRQRFSPAIWPLLPPLLTRQIQESAAQLQDPPGETHQALMFQLRALEAQRAALQEARALVPRLEQQLRALPLNPPDLRAEVPLLERTIGSWEATFEGFRALIAELDPEQPQNPSASGHQLYATFQVDGVPYAIRCLSAKVSAWADAICKVQLGTSVPLGFPSLRLRPEELRHTLLLKPLRLLSEQEVGELSFDSCFLIEGAPQAVEQLLSFDIRQRLAQLARYDVPILEVDAGRAVLSWTYGPERALLQIACSVLAALRGRPVQLRLLRDPEPAAP